MVSYSFEINDEVYKPVHLGMLRALYYNRCGCQLLEKHAGIYHHGTCHNDKVLRWNDHQYRIECSGGWHDAGDYGRYITPGAVTIGHLLYAYKLYPNAFEESMNIPESGNGIADVLNECRYELEWMLKMQTKDGGVYHKLTSWNHVDFIMPEEDQDPFYLFEISSLATADFCAIMALSYRVFKEVDY